MNFLSAIKHAAIDYGIRRVVWPKYAILSLGNGNRGDTCQLYWLNVSKDQAAPCHEPVKLCGPDLTYDLSPEDIAATDWEVI